MKKVFGGLLLALLLAVVGTGAGWLWLARSIESPVGAAPHRTVEFTVPRGATGRSLGVLLEKEGLLQDQRIWRFHLWQRGGLAAKAGRFSLSTEMSLQQIAMALEGVPLPEDQPFVMIEGWRLRDTDAALAAAGWIEPGTYLAAAKEVARYKAPFDLPSDDLEGYLYPETYAVVPDAFNVHDLIQRQLDTFVRRFYEPHRAEIQKSGRKLHELVIMASLLEREEPLPDQRPLVAGILWKRIDRGVPLGVDATSRYELSEWNDRRAFLQRLRDPEDRWNTRTRKGLPPGPIGAPSVASLQSALRPVESEYWYYLHDADRILRPSRNGAEHEALRKKYNVY